MAAPTDLVTIRPGTTFSSAAAASWRRMEAAVGYAIGTNSTYRDYDEQLTAYQNYQRDPRNYPRALHPDYSFHCKGLAADTNNVSLLRSLSSHGWRQTAADEDWHFEYQAWLDAHRHETADSGSTAFPTTPSVPQEDDMIAIRIQAGAQGDHLATLGLGTFRHLLGTDDFEWIKNVITADDQWTNVPLAKLPGLLRTYGCDLNIYRIVNKEFQILDPLTGNIGPGNVWTAVNANRGRTVAPVEVVTPPKA